MAAMAVHGNPYNGHTLSRTLAQVECIAKKPEKAFVYSGYWGLYRQFFLSLPL